ncbi:MAG: hypothetical protein ACI4XJ_08295 [Eubacteriales bacterium]
MINKSNIEKMLDMPDDKLLMMLKLVMGSAGIDIGSKKIDEKTVKKIRALLREITDEDIDRITYLSGVYKSGV